MCQSADCQLSGMDKENWDWNNNNNSNNMQSVCHCMMNRRVRRRHPATIQTPGRLEVGEVILEPLVSNRLEDNSGAEDRGWSDSLWKPSYLSSNTANQSLQSKQQRFDVLSENLVSSGGGGGGGWKPNYSSTSSSKLT